MDNESKTDSKELKPRVKPAKVEEAKAARTAAADKKEKDPGDAVEPSWIQLLNDYVIGFSTKNMTSYMPPSVTNARRLHPVPGQGARFKDHGENHGFMASLMCLFFERLAAIQDFAVRNVTFANEYYKLDEKIESQFGWKNLIATQLLWALDCSFNIIRDFWLIMSILPGMIRWFFLGSLRFPALEPFWPRPVSVFSYLPAMLYTACFGDEEVIRYDEINLKEGRMFTRLAVWDMLKFLVYAAETAETEQKLVGAIYTAKPSESNSRKIKHDKDAANGRKDAANGREDASEDAVLEGDKEDDAGKRVYSWHKYEEVTYAEGTRHEIMAYEAPTTITKPRFAEQHWFVVNGMLTTSEVARTNGQLLEKMFQQPIRIIFNPTWGFCLDAMECAFGRTLGLRSRPAKFLFAHIDAQLKRDLDANWGPYIGDSALADLAEERISHIERSIDEEYTRKELPANIDAVEIKKVVIIAHSQGTLITNNVLRVLEEKYPHIDLSKEEEANRAKLQYKRECDRMRKQIRRGLEVYLMGCACDEVRSIAGNHIEIFSNTGDMISNMSVLHPYFSQYIEGHRFNVDRIGHMFVMDYLKHFTSDHCDESKCTDGKRSRLTLYTQHASKA